MKRTQRMTIFESQITPDGSEDLLNVYLQRDKAHVNRLFILLKNQRYEFEMQEFHITIKQATELLIKCNHDFRMMVSELLCVTEGRIVLRNIAQKLLLPKRYDKNQNENQTNEKLHNNSIFTHPEQNQRPSSNPSQEEQSQTHHVDNPDEIEFK